ncbi:MAG: hypothetical protein ABEJ65_03435, partial [bacterium]
RRIQNVVHETQGDNPLSKLVEVDVDGGQALFRTTNGKLAEHLGRALEQSYKGTLSMEKSDDLTRVIWERST